MHIPNNENKNTSPGKKMQEGNRYRLSRSVHLNDDPYRMVEEKRPQVEKEDTKEEKELPLSKNEQKNIQKALAHKIETQKVKKAVTIFSAQKEIPNIEKRKGVFHALVSETIPVNKQEKKEGIITKKQPSVFVEAAQKNRRTRKIECISVPQQKKAERLRRSSTCIKIANIKKKEEAIKTQEKAEEVETAAPKQKTKKRRFFAQKKKVRKVKKTGFVAEMSRFAITTAIIFLVSFTVMNAPAISQVMSAKLNPMATTEKQIALENAVSEKKYSPILPTAGMKHENRKTYPGLSIAIAPLENRIVIPKIGKNIPTVDIPTTSLENQDWDALENEIQTALKDGVVHYPGTADPGQVGNVFLTGHSSYYLWDPGKYKDVFARLHDMEVGDEFTIFWEQDVYHYKIHERKVVPPEETSVLDQPRDKKIATLMTCTPIGTAKDRLILVAEQVN